MDKWRQLMRLSKQELFFINEITDGPKPFGVFLKYDKSISAEEQKHMIISSMKQKELMDEKENFTESAIFLLQMWELYRKCETHLVINQSYVAVATNRRAVILKPIENEYEIYTLDSAKILFAIIKDCAFMQREDYEIEEKVFILDYDTIQKKQISLNTNSLIIGEFYKNVTKEEVLYYWDEKKGYQYNFHTKEQREISPRMMRIRMMKYLQMGEYIDGR